MALLQIVIAVAGATVALGGAYSRLYPLAAFGAVTTVIALLFIMRSQTLR